MAALTTQSANDVLNYILRNVTPSWGATGTIYWSLHTATPTVAGDQTANEVAYTGYARVAAVRSAGGLLTAASGGASENNAIVTFGNPTAGSFPITATHVGLGEVSSGAGTLIMFAALVSPLVININVQPNFAVGALDFTAV